MSGFVFENIKEIGAVNYNGLTKWESLETG